MIAFTPGPCDSENSLVELVPL